MYKVNKNKQKKKQQKTTKYQMSISFVNLNKKPPAVNISMLESGRIISKSLMSSSLPDVNAHSHIQQKDRKMNSNGKKKTMNTIIYLTFSLIPFCSSLLTTLATKHERNK